MFHLLLLGMTTETMKKLFESYSQANLSVSRTHGGTGLVCRRVRCLCHCLLLQGLAIVHRLVGLMVCLAFDDRSTASSLCSWQGGTISVCSEVGKGSQFIVKIPTTVRNHEHEHVELVRDCRLLLNR